MELVLILEPYAKMMAFISLSVSVLAGLWCDWLGGGIKFGNKRDRTPPTGGFGKFLHQVSRYSMIVFWLCLVVILGSGLTNS